MSIILYPGDMPNDFEDLVWSLNLINGQVARIQRHVFEHPAFSANQVEVAPFSESFDADKWKPISKEAWLAKHQDTEIATSDGVDPKHPESPVDQDAGEAPSPRATKHSA